MYGGGEYRTDVFSRVCRASFSKLDAGVLQPREGTLAGLRRRSRLLYSILISTSGSLSPVTKSTLKTRPMPGQ
jgi:hypothetical protein